MVEWGLAAFLGLVGAVFIWFGMGGHSLAFLLLCLLVVYLNIEDWLIVNGYLKRSILSNLFRNLG